MVAGAADLPEELLKPIVVQAATKAWDHGRFFEDTDDGLKERLFMFNCSLVCLQWANVCRKAALQRVIVRSAVQIRRLGALLDSPCSPRLIPLHKLIVLVSIRHSDPTPWLHEVPRLWGDHSRYPRPGHVHEIKLSSYTTASTINRTFVRSLFYYLPRTIPAMAAMFETLHLGQVQCAVAADFFRMLEGLSNIRRVDVVDVTWNPSSPMPPSFHIPQFLTKYRLIDTDRRRLGGKGSLPWFLSALLTYTPRPPRRRISGDVTSPATSHHERILRDRPVPGCCPSEWPLVYDLVQTFSPQRESHGDEAKEEIEWFIHFHEGDRSSEHNVADWPRTGVCRYLKISGTICGRFDIIPTIHVRYHLPAGASTDTATRGYLHVKTICIDFRLQKSSETPHHMLQFDWRRIFDVSLQFVGLVGIEFAFLSSVTREEIFALHKETISEAIREEEDEARRQIAESREYRYSVLSGVWTTKGTITK